MGNTLASIESDPRVSRLETFSSNMFDQCCRRPDSSEWLNEVTVVADNGNDIHTTPKATPTIVATPSTPSIIGKQEEGRSVGGVEDREVTQTVEITAFEGVLEEDHDDDVADEREGAADEDIEADCFKIDIQRIPGVRLGIDVDHSDPRWLVVDRVTPEGSIDLWNRKAPPGQKLQKGDIIVRVNDVRMDAMRMVEQCQASSVLHMWAKRPKLIRSLSN
ncbi:hypothetical protein Pmar_PMAR019984 [Perkinsus marinus ATCC 50983]|uniref:PDZ domain-containing protein n=1 Tax=Perkinsus marinus (strain ATCC 50983 / TXsc) TaxID=423536 RepID=C5LJ90_PERM5|nr:hypothetical protein Pmar_PMAR019984 [Perkinsus marinus ATCC 50983]EER03206.1 hypothetical protein Pmar_PMAR019984 [Perkinsus marinus ATCC 50983]|eukprot:XP_002771390.1 hypothetical protein Pmar_PMAR019984 [Perkinsus marinus ATCC 50983]